MSYFAFISAAVLAFLFGCASADPAGRDLRQVDVARVAVDVYSAAPVVVLSEREGSKRELPIWIGSFEARSIALGMEGVAIPRPNPHDLIHDLLKQLGGELRRVVVTDLREGVYYAEIELQVAGQALVIDARPSDAIAVALRFGAPLYVVERVLSQNAIEDSDDEERVDI